MFDRLVPFTLNRRRLLLLVAAIIAGAGVAYELSLMLLGTVTVGSTERANAIVLGVTMAGMGLGATNGGRWAKKPVSAFLVVEIALALVGASAAPFLYWTWAQLDSFWGPLLVVSLTIGFCIGAEMPLLAALNDRLAKQSPTKVVADYTAADYFGALAGALGFAFVVRPYLGLVSGTFAIALLNLAAAAAVVFIVPTKEKTRLLVWAAIGLAALGLLTVISPGLVNQNRQALFRDPIIKVAESNIQEIVVTSRTHRSGVTDTRLFLNGDLQLSSVDEHRYHEALVHPAMPSEASDIDVLILGGGDCLAAREVLRHDSVRSVTLVELDSEVFDVVRSVPELHELQEGACDDDRLTVIIDDAFTWVRDQAKSSSSFNAVVVDFPDPDTVALGRLYSVEMFRQLSQVLVDDARMTIQCGSPFFSPQAYWTCAHTLESAGWQIAPYHVDVPSFGDWGFHLATTTTPTEESPIVKPLAPVEGLRFLTDDVLAASQVFPLDRQRQNYRTEPSTILNPTIVEASQQDWLGYDN